MSGHLQLTSPWARAGIPAPDRQDVIAAIPDGWSLNVSVSPDRRTWIFRANDSGTFRGTRRVSASMSLRTACFYALRHWGLERSVTVKTDALGFVKSIEDDVA